MTLTREEQKSVLRMVMESHQGITISEVKSNQDIREEIKSNLKFYNEVKKGFLNETKSNILEAEGILNSILSVIGTVKNAISAVGFGKDAIEWVKNFITEFIEKFKKVIIDYVPGGESIIKGAKTVAEYTAKFVKWVYNTISYKGLAKLFAMIRYKTFSPTEEQKKCMELAAKKVYKWILIALIAAYIIKVISTAGPSLAISAALFSTPGTMAFAFAPLKSLIAAAGLKGTFFETLSLSSAVDKTLDADKLADQIEAEEQKAKAGELDGFGEAWNMCPLKPLETPINTPFDSDDYYNTEESLRMQKLAGIV
jgi:hypothetical protein